MKQKKRCEVCKDEPIPGELRIFEMILIVNWEPKTVGYEKCKACNGTGYELERARRVKSEGEGT